MVMLDLDIHEHRPLTWKIEPGQTSSLTSDNDDQNEDKSRWSNNNDHVADIFKEMGLYLAARNGSINDFSRDLDRISCTQQAPYAEILSRTSPAGNTLLHVAVTNGNLSIATYIVAKSPNSLFDKNLNEDTALHLASKAGNELMVRYLVQNLRELPDIEVAAKKKLLSAKNEKGNTALLEALNNGHDLAAQRWIQDFPEIAYIQNNKCESALYLAAKAGFVKCIDLILVLCRDDHECLMEQFQKKSPIQAAVMMYHKDVLDAMLSWNVQLRDGEGRTALHYAASLGYLEEVWSLLQNYAPYTTKKDNSGSCPIHLASIEGHVDIVHLLLQYCPAPMELLDMRGRSILHAAAESGKFSLVKYILNIPELEELINMKDKDGNTPLHLATKNWHPKIVSYLTWDKRVDVKLVNDAGETSLDVAWNNMYENPPFHQRLTWAALTAAGTPRSSGKTAKRQRSEQTGTLMVSLKERVNTLLLVSTLVATITFAAGFTMPGGYNDSDPDVGTATMLRHRGLHVFVLCDTIAMHCSIVAVVALVFAQLGDLSLVLATLRLALPLLGILGIALGTMSMAFTAGVFLVMNKLRWLSITVLIVGLAFLAVLSFLLVTLFMPISSSNRILRYLSYYPFCFLILATRS